MDTQKNTQSENLSSSGAGAPELAVDGFAVRSAADAGPSSSSSISSASDELPVTAPDLWEVAAREGCEWSFSSEGLRAVRRVNLGELMALLGAEVVEDEASGTLTDEFRAKTGVLKKASRLRLSVCDNMRRRWEVDADNEPVFTVRLMLDYANEVGAFEVGGAGSGWCYNLKLESAFCKKGGAA